MNHVKSFESFLNESSEAERKLDNKYLYDLFYEGRPSNNGWKLSVQGKTFQDAVELWDKAHTWLLNHNIAHKYGTIKRIEKASPEQSRKLLTIYVPDDMNVKDLALKVEYLLKGYKGWHDIKTPHGYEHYSGGIFFRNDRDEAGNYIPAKDAK